MNKVDPVVNLALIALRQQRHLTFCVFSTTVIREVYLFQVVVGVLKIGQKKGCKPFSLIESNNELSIPIRAQVKGHLN